jgi:hypothetical protein
MLERVLRTLAATPCIREIIVSIDEPRLLGDYPGITALRGSDDVRVVVVEATDSPSRSVLAILDEGASEQPLLVTTADHALLTVEMVEHFLGQAEQRGGDLAVGLVAASVLKARFPGSSRTWLRFSGEQYSGANLFAFQTPRARRAVEFWGKAEKYRKQPWRLVATFGLRRLALFLRRRLTLDAAFVEVSEALGVRACAVAMPQAEAAIDVDKLADLDLVRQILEEAGEGAEQGADENPAAETDTGGRPETDPDQSTRSPSPTKPPLVAS